MASRKPRAKSHTASLFALAERQIVGLYNAGVLSPAVLHHVVAAYAHSDIDWGEQASLRTVDDRSMQEAVVLTMMPGRALRSAQKDFMSVVTHLAAGDGAGAKPSASSEEPSGDDEEDSEDDETLLDQLGGNRRDAERSQKNDEGSTVKRKAAGFNPLVGARAVSNRGKG